MSFFNNNARGFMLRFALILTLSFGVFFLVDYLGLSDDGNSAARASRAE